MPGSTRFPKGLLLAAAVLCTCTPPPPSPPVRALSSQIDETSAPYFSAPWPDDRRLNSDGTFNTSTFPNPEGQSAGYFPDELQAANRLLHGFGTAAPIYMPFTGTIDTVTLPEPLAKDGSVFALNIDPASPERGARNPLDFHFYDAPTLFLPGHVLAVRPVPGLPLQGHTRYAVVVTTDVKDVNGNPVAPEEAFARVLAGQPQNAQEQAEVAWFKPLFDDLNQEGFPLSRVASATIFTTEPILDELLVLRDYLLAQPVPGVPDLALVKGRPASEPYWLFEGHYLAPHMQHGTLPYLFTGGDFEYGPDGTPIPDFMESMRLAVVVPKGPVPPGGFPFILYSHGTGGDFESIVNEGNGIGLTVSQAGMAGFGIDQVLTGPRAGGTTETCFGDPIENCFIDYVNPVALRNNLRQAALDNVFLRQVARHLVIPASVDPDGVEVTFQQDGFGFVGHSQGGITGALYTAIDPELWGSVISGAGGLFGGTILERKDPDAQSLVEGPLFLGIEGKESIDWYHPALALIQTWGEIVDPLNYARYWAHAPVGRAKNIYATSGLQDQFTKPDTAEYMIAAASLPRLLPIERVSAVLDLAGVAPVMAPLRANLPGLDNAMVTGVFRQFPDVGHFAIFDCPGARMQYSSFLASMLQTGVATVPVDSTMCTEP